MSTSLQLLRAAGVALVFGVVLGVVYAVARDPSSPPRRAHAAYVARLNLALDRLFRPRLGQLIAAAQLGIAPLFAALGLASMSVHPWGGLLLTLSGPALWLQRALARRRLLLEQQLPGVAESLANSLRTTPNLAGALQQTQRLSPPGMAEELDLMLKELRVGSALEPALARMGLRVGSHDLDALTAGLLIARQTGGNLSEILETLADSLREMARLAGLLRTKTADNRGQFLLIALLPGVAIWLLGSNQSGYFKPLLDTSVGWWLMGLAIALWLGALLIARKVLAVEL